MGVTRDIAILGSGPAALSIGAALARFGCEVTLIAPKPHAPWKANYCLWTDEVPERVASAVERAWPAVAVATDRGERRLGRGYSKFDGRALADSLWTDLRTGGARVVDGRAVSIEHESDASRITIEAGAREHARVVIDASGAGTPFVVRSSRRIPAHQVAYGVFLEAPAHRFDPDCAVLMDFRAADGHAAEPPSFLYALPLEGDRLFIEETSLAHRPPVSFELLRTRLGARLRSWGLGGCEVLGEEHCVIPMGVPLPTPHQPLVPFGAAASMVNPASGYSIAHALRKAEPVALSITRALATGGRTAAIAAGNSTVWPDADRSAWDLYAVGLESLVDMNAKQTSAFFDGFFEMPEEDWSGILSGTLSPREVGGAMARVFRTVPPSVRWHLVTRSFSSGFGPFAKAFLQPGIA